jgi:hypothetical protein
MIEKVIPLLGYMSNVVIERLRFMAYLNMVYIYIYIYKRKKIVLTHFLFMMLFSFLMSVIEQKDFTKM